VDKPLEQSLIPSKHALLMPAEFPVLFHRLSREMRFKAA